jgi:cytochrome P450
VLVNIYAIGRDPKKWKKPLEFSPDRFLEGGKLKPDAKAGGVNYNLLPFGSGRRSCPGYPLAMVSLLRVAGSLLHAFDWSPPPEMAPEDLSTEEKGGIVLEPSPEFCLVPTPRLSDDV